MKLSKVLSLVLAIAMLLSVPTFAAFTDVAANANYAEAVTVLSALEIINGYGDGTFKPEGKITRAEYSAIICRAIGMGDAAKGSITDSFTDVPATHWANGYIATAQNAGIINGMGDGTFAPEAEVTYEQAVKMLVCALGYEKKAIALGGYPTGYMMVAIQESITTGTNNTPGGADRATVARLTYNALTVPMMDQTSWGSDEKFEAIPYSSLLWSKLDAFTAEVKIASISLDKEATDVTLDVRKVDKVAAHKNNGLITESAATSFLGDQNVKINGVDLAGLQGLTVTAVIDKSDDSEMNLLCIVPKSGKNAEVTINPQLLVNRRNGDYVEYYKNVDDDKESKLKLDANVDAYINLVKATSYDGVFGADAVNAEANRDADERRSDVAYKYVDTDNNGAYDTLFVTNEKVFVVGDVNTSSNKIFRADAKVEPSFTASNLQLDPEDDNVSWTMVDAEGNAIELADVKKGDVVAVKESSDNGFTVYEIAVSNTVVEGTITETFTETSRTDATIHKFKIDDAEYTLLDGSQMDPGDTVTAKVYGNKVVDYAVAKGVQNYGLVIGRNNTTEFGKTIYQLQLLNTEGEVVTYDFAERDAQANYDLTTDGALVVYELNKSGEIKSINNLDDDEEITVRATAQYKATSAKLGSNFVTEDTIVFTTDYANTFSKENVDVANIDCFAEDTDYDYVAIKNSNKEILAVVLYAAANQVDMDTYPLVITKLASVTVDGEQRDKLFGYVNGENAEFVLAENAEITVIASEADDTTALVNVGDIVMFTTNAAGEMMRVEHLVDKNGSNFVVKTNNADDDEDLAVAGKPVTLTTAGNVNATGEDVEDYLKGFGVAGRAYKVQNNLLRIVKAADMADLGVYPEEHEFEGQINYTKDGNDEGLISDYSVSTSAVAYLYDVETGKFKVASLLDAETDYSTRDYKDATQEDNDDLVYAYNFDGETKLILIIDTNSDN